MRRDRARGAPYLDSEVRSPRAACMLCAELVVHGGAPSWCTWRHAELVVRGGALRAGARGGGRCDRLGTLRGEAIGLSGGSVQDISGGFGVENAVERCQHWWGR